MQMRDAAMYIHTPQSPTHIEDEEAMHTPPHEPKQNETRRPADVNAGAPPKKDDAGVVPQREDEHQMDLDNGT